MAHKGGSTELEWLGEPVLLRTTGHLKGRKVLVADSAVGAFRGGKIPNLAGGIRQRSAEYGGDEYLRGRLGAGWDSGVVEFLAKCNQAADGKATEVILRPDVTGIFIPKEDLAGPVFLVNGAVVLDVSTSLDTIYEDSLQKKAQQGITGYDSRCNTGGQLQALLTGDLTSESAKKLMLLRQLGTQEERDQSSGTCVWCGKRDSLRATHLKIGCPEFEEHRPTLAATRPPSSTHT